MPADYLKDLIEKAKKTSRDSAAENDFLTSSEEKSEVPGPAPGEKEADVDIESKISAVREGLKKGLKESRSSSDKDTLFQETPSKQVSRVPSAFKEREQLFQKQEKMEKPTEKPSVLTERDSGFSALKQKPLFREAEQSQEIEMDLEGEEENETRPFSEPFPAPSPKRAALGAIPAAEAKPGILSKRVESEEGEKVSEVEKTIARIKEKILVDSYGSVKIYKVPSEKQLYYFVPVPKSTGSEKRIVRTIKEAATRLITISPFRIRDPEQRRAVYRQRIMEILESAPEIQIPKGKRGFYTDAVVREMVGYGMIDQLIRDDRLEEIMVTGSKKPVYVFHRDYEMMKTNIEFFSDSEIIDLINRIGREVGRRVDFADPLLDARLADGSRVNATIKPISVSGPTITIRKFKKDPLSIIDLINYGTLTTEVAAFLWLAVEGVETRPANILISGGTGSGKTSTLNVLASFIPETERVITIEDTAELNLPLEHWIRFESRPPGLENKGEITLDILTKNALRMRPDRIIVGEIRHNEAFSLFTAMNTGHDGSIGTVHANSAQETLVRVTNPPMNVPESMLSGLNFIVVENRLHDRKKGTIRRITEISEVTGVLEGKAQAQSIFEWDAVSDKLKKTGVPSNYLRELSKLAGLSIQQIEKEIKRRQAFLETLLKENIRSIGETSKRMKEFLLTEGER